MELNLLLGTAACPSCPAAVAARALVFSHEFWTNAWYVLLPFGVVGWAVLRIVRLVDRRTSREDDDEQA